MNTILTKNIKSINLPLILVGITPILLLILLIGLFSGYQLAEMYLLKQIWPIAIISTITALAGFVVLPKLAHHPNSYKTVSTVFLFFLLLNLVISFNFVVPYIPPDIQLLALFAFASSAGWLYFFSDKMPANIEAQIQLPDFLQNLKPFTLLLPFMLLGFLVRLWHLSEYGYYGDEGFHLFDIDRFINGTDSFLSGDYIKDSRAPFVSYMAALSCYVAGAETFEEFLFWGKFPSVVIGTLTAIPIFLLGNKISKIVGLLAAFLWLTSPWSIGINQYIREYTYYVFFTLITVYYVLKVLPLIIDYKPANNKYLVTLFVLLSVFLLYAFFIDIKSTLKINAGIIAVIIGGYFVLNFEKLGQYRWLLLFFTLIIMSFVCFWVFNQLGNNGFLKSEIAFENSWAKVFFHTNKKSPVHWWSIGNNNLFLVYFLFIVAWIGAIWRKQQHLLIFVVLFVAALFFYSYVFGRYFRPRYIFYLQAFYILILASALYYMYRTTQLFEQKAYQNVLLGVLCLFSLNLINPIHLFQTTKAAPLTEEYRFLPTNELHYDANAIIAFLKKYDDSQIEKMGFIANNYRVALEIQWDLPICKGCVDERFKDAALIVQKYKAGCIIKEKSNKKCVEKLINLIEEQDDIRIKLIEKGVAHEIYAWKHL